MTGTPDDRYFEWLYGLIGSVRNRNPARSYWELAKVLYSTEYIWLVSNDDNRVEDGKELRLEFIDERGSDGVDPQWMNLGCSTLEMLIALSRRAAFESRTEPVEWFGIFLRNLELVELTDAHWQPGRTSAMVDSKLETLIFRNYSPTGDGGLFPLTSPGTDQRKVELWYQLASYLQENPTL